MLNLLVKYFLDNRLIIFIFLIVFVVTGLSLMLISSCRIDNKDDPAPILTEGQFYQGGILACILQQGDPGYDANVQHGLIAAPYDQSTGNANTNTIVNMKGAGNYAAKLCYDLVRAF